MGETAPEKGTILAVLLCLCVAQAWAQDVLSAFDGRDFYGSFYLSANFSQIDGDGFSGYHKFSIAGGASIWVRPFKELPWSLFAASLSIGYAQKGSHEASLRDTYTGPAVFRYRVQLRYAELLLLVHFIGFRRVHYTAGIAYRRLLAPDETSEDVSPILISPELYPFCKQDWSGIAGSGFRIWRGWFAIGQYQYTVGSIRDEPYIPPGYGWSHQRNNVMTIRLLSLTVSGGER